MTAADLTRTWDALPPGPRAALEQQWVGLAAGGLPCGAAIVGARSVVVARGHNRAYNAAGPLVTRGQLPLQGSVSPTPNSTPSRGSPPRSTTPR